MRRPSPAVAAGRPGPSPAKSRLSRGRSGGARKPPQQRPARTITGSYYALTVPGIEDLASVELRAAGATPRNMLAGFDRRDSLVPFDARDAAPALRCGLLEDVFAVLLDTSTPRGRLAPHAIARAIERAAFERAMLAHHTLRPRERGRSFKVVARVAGHHPFRRQDLESAVSSAVSALLPRWRPARGAAAVEVWAHVIGDRTIVGLRLSGDELAQRRYKRAHLPASLKPTVARALVTLAGVRPGDVFVDPMAGAGTVLRERAEAGAAGAIFGGDSDRRAVEAARHNVGRGVQLFRWNATRLPLRPGSVDVIATNPPYGRRHRTEGKVGRLYAGLAAEAARVLRPGGRFVALTGEPAALTSALPRSLPVLAKRRLLLRGLEVTAVVMQRR